MFASCIGGTGWTQCILAFDRTALIDCPCCPQSDGNDFPFLDRSVYGHGIMHKTPHCQQHWLCLFLLCFWFAFGLLLRLNMALSGLAGPPPGLSTSTNPTATMTTTSTSSRALLREVQSLERRLGPNRPSSSSFSRSSSSASSSSGTPASQNQFPPMSSKVSIDSLPLATHTHTHSLSLSFSFFASAFSFSSCDLPVPHVRLLSTFHAGVFQ